MAFFSPQPVRLRKDAKRSMTAVVRKNGIV